MARNPYVKPNQVLGQSDAAWTALKAKVQTYLQSNSDKDQIDDATVRAIDPMLADDRTWNQLKAELGL